MDKVFLGLDCASLDKGIESEAITKVEILNNDGEIVGQAGTTTGKTLTVTNPDGNNTMASYILSQVSGYVQRGYNASRAIIDPAAELGDGVTVGGIYSVIASENINYDALYTSDISAPDADEVDDEYPYQTYQQRVERKVAGAWSAITKTNNSISLIVDSTTGNVTAAKIVASINDAGSEVKISADHVAISGYVTFTDLSTEGSTAINGANITTGTISANRIAANSITLGKLSSGVQESLDNADTALSDVTDLADGDYSGGTFINGKGIYSPNIYAGTIYATNGSNSSYSEMNSAGFRVYEYDSDDREYDLKCVIGHNSNMPYANQMVKLGSDNPLYIEKYFASSHKAWIGNSAMTCGIMMDFTNGTVQIVQ